MACGARPVIAVAGEDGYVVKCPNNDHYKTPPGIIDIENWNRNNQTFPSTDFRITVATPGQ